MPEPADHQRPLLPLVAAHAHPAPTEERPLAGLRYVDIETSRYCNRTCSWCPNEHTTARRAQQLMDWHLFAKITAELATAGFAGFFAFHNYNEPLANPRLFDEIAQVRRDIPEASPAIYTNGDLLSRTTVERLGEEGVKYLRVTRYPHRANVLPTFEALRRWLTKTKLLDGMDWQFTRVRQGLAATWIDPARGMKVEVIRPAIATYNDRGGTAAVPLAAPTRTAPCQMTDTSLSVDFRGQMKMCCNVVPDVTEHHRYVVGNVADHTLAELWMHPTMVDWRERHALADWSRSPGCATCPQVLPETRR
ncbi:radical SAM protein [Streptantibioticus ferralitis]|uniref:Radical SAM protein n=1 Tax=Streptantibioticus ferralitis TaxID=236510 RepID=A0ABT5Z524_9ACTN|nr:radical SAM/SPASM domain-containing protein [Streptantibioticus ferralitis]MDF2258925.1 radical SAM protein [Streptantibioticus ferralitis]